MAVDRGRLLDIAVPLGLVAGTMAVRLPRLGRPNVLVFDEIYYVLDAGDLLRHGVEQGRVVHPPLGKWFIAAGIRAVGLTPAGWRLAVLVAGALTVLLTYVAARQIIAGRGLPALAAVAVALDGVTFTTGRISLLDGFATLFTTAAVVLLLAAYRRPGDRHRVRRCRWWAAVVLGLGLATKWSAAVPLAAIAVAFGALVIAGPEPAGGKRRALLATAATFTVVPLLVYIAAYGPWLANAGHSAEGLERCGERPCSLGVADRVDALVDEHVRIARFHRDLRPENVFAAPAWSWALQSEPVVLFERYCPDPSSDTAADDGVCTGSTSGRRATLAVTGNPAVWWPALAAGGVLAVRAVRRRDMTARLLVGLGLALWVPWMVTGREVFLFYAAPLVPVLALWLATALARPPGRLMAGVLAAVIVVLAAVLHPVWTATPLNPDGVDARLWWTGG